MRPLRLQRLDCLIAGLLAAAVTFCAGCATRGPTLAPASVHYGVPGDPSAVLAPWENPHIVFPERLAQGYTIVLPGIGSDAGLDHGVVVGLHQANVNSAIELYNWTSTASPLGIISDLRGLARNRQEGQKLARKICLYRARYPGRPVHIIGYSGGGGVALLALEALPPQQTATSAILLAPTVSSDFDLRPALSHTEVGICNFYSPFDVPVLMILGTAFGTTDGKHAIPAGAIGFDMQRTPDARPFVMQKSYQLSMLSAGHTGGHFGWATPSFVAKYLAPLVDPSLPLPPEIATRPGGPFVK